VSVDALLHEQDARELLAAVVRSLAPHHPITAAFKPRKVIYGIALDFGKARTVDTLFTFSQVALYRAVRRLRSDGVEVEVVGIPKVWSFGRPGRGRDPT
jgi:uncharacterized protein (TIGR04141 family)